MGECHWVYNSVTLTKVDNLQWYSIGRTPALHTCKDVLAPSLVVNFRAADVAHKNIMGAI